MPPFPGRVAGLALAEPGVERWPAVADRLAHLRRFFLLMRTSSGDAVRSR